MLSDSCLSVCPVCLSCLSVTLVYRGQTVEWIEMPLDMEVCLGPGDTALDRAQLLQRKRAQHPHTFRPMSIVTKLSTISATA